MRGRRLEEKCELKTLMKEDYGFFEKYWIICIAVIIVCINIGCRIKDGIANRAYETVDTLIVMYDPDNLYDERYLAKRDWISGEWLDLEKNYDSPLIIAGIVLTAGIVYLYLIGAAKPIFKNSWMVFSSVFVAKIPGRLRKKEETESNEPEE